MQQHGFARNVDWQIASTSADPQPDDRDPEVRLRSKAWAWLVVAHSMRQAFMAGPAGSLPDMQPTPTIARACLRRSRWC